MENNLYFDVHTHLAVAGMERRSVVSALHERIPAPGFRFAVGIHPWTLGELGIEKRMALVESLVDHPDCVAIGECGLDRPDASRIGRQLMKAPVKGVGSVHSVDPIVKKEVMELGFGEQLRVFKRHIEIANLANKPIIIHCVRAFQELTTLKQISKNSIPWIIHGFRGSAEIAKSLVAQGVYISFGRLLTRRNYPGWSKVANALESVPLNRLFLETDDTETPNSKIEEVYEVVAEIKGIPLSVLIDGIYSNATVAKLLPPLSHS